MSLFYLLFAAAFARAWPPIPWLHIDEYTGEICDVCHDGGFVGPETGYDGICDNCAGQSVVMSSRCEALSLGYTSFMSEVKA